MWEYLQINISIFCLTLLALFVLRKAPAKYRLSITLVSLLLWLVPWQAISISLPSALVEPIRVFKVYELQDVTTLFANDAEPDWMSLDQELESIEDDSDQANKEASPILASDAVSLHAINRFVLFTFLTLTIIGGMLLVYGALKYVYTLRLWQRHSRCANALKSLVQEHSIPYDIRYLSGYGPGSTTGFLKPIIWIDPNIKDEATLRSILVHELTHIKHCDALLVAIVSAVRTLFWWNPFVKVLYDKAREDIEVRCDESSVHQVDEALYIKSIATLLLSEHKQNHGVSIAGLGKHANFNMRRIEILQSAHIQKPIHFVCMGGFTIAVLIFALAFSYDEKLHDFIVSDSTYQVVDANAVTVEYDYVDKDLFNFKHLIGGERPRQSGASLYAVKR